MTRRILSILAGQHFSFLEVWTILLVYRALTVVDEQMTGWRWVVAILIVGSVITVIAQHFLERSRR